MGMGRCFIRSQTLAMLQADNSYSTENSPPTSIPKVLEKSSIKIIASRKFGVAKPMKPKKVHR